MKTPSMKTPTLFHRRVPVAVVLLLIVALLAPASSAVAQAPEPAAPQPSIYMPLAQLRTTSVPEYPGTTAYIVPEAEQQAALEYWTYERRAAAQPLPAPDFSNESAELSAAASVAEAPVLVRSGAPAPGAEAEAMVAFAADRAELAAFAGVDEAQLFAELETIAAEGLLEPEGTVAVYSSWLSNYYGELWKPFPYRAIGKLYISGAGTCTASVISPNNILATAAHCVFNRATNRWYPGWTFVPADRNGAAPYGSWTAHHARVMTVYITSGGMRYDVALVKLNQKYISGAWRPVSYYTGYLGRAANLSYTLHLHSFGYPSNLNSGRYTWTCAAESYNLYGVDVRGMGCNMTYGSSGGPWLYRFNPYAGGSVNYAVGVVSGDPSVTGKSFYGPRFSSANFSPLCSAEGC